MFLTILRLNVSRILAAAAAARKPWAYFEMTGIQYYRKYCKLIG